MENFKHKRLSKMRKKEILEFYLVISPWIIGFCLFIGYPIVYSFFLSFTEWDLLSPPRFIGIKNYVELTIDPLSRQSLKVTGIYTIASVFIILGIGFSIALLLNQRIRGVYIFRVLFYLPVVFAGVAVALLWMWIFNPDFGLINYLLSLVGIKGPAWLYDTKYALWALIIMSIWGAGGPMLIYLAGLQSIPTQLYEAAIIDGAGPWKKFWHITIPMISPVILFNLVIGFISSFQVFTQAFVMTNGGPYHATLFYVLYLYQNAFKYFKMGFASAQAWILFVIILTVTLLIFKSSARWVYYEAGRRR